MRTTYNDLSIWLKACVICSWISIAIVGMGFLIGFIEGFLGAY
jgi:hypothetical protein